MPDAFPITRDEARLLRELKAYRLPFHHVTLLLFLYRNLMSADLQTTTRCNDYANALACVADAIKRDT